MASEENVFVDRIVRDHEITDKELQFMNWMETLPESVMEKDAIEIKGDIDEDDINFG